MENNFLNDDWEVSGNDFDEFKASIDELTKHTKAEVIPMNEIRFLSVSNQESGYMAVPLQADALWKKTKTAMSLRKYDIDKYNYIVQGYSDETVNEAFDNGLFLVHSKKKLSTAKSQKMIENGNYIPVSKMAINTICNRIKHFGYGFLSEHLIRDLAIADKFDKPIPVTLITRQDDETGNKKVFSIMSERYAYIPQTYIKEIIESLMNDSKEDLGDAVCSKWYINHSTTRVYLEFPKCGEEIYEAYGLPDTMIPGIMIETSDIGDCSLRIRGFYRISGLQTTVYMPEEYSQIHAGDISYEDILTNVKKEIFPKYMYYPEHLADLMAIDLIDDSMNENKRIKTMSSIYRKISKHIGLVKAIGKNREKNLIEQLIDSINPEIDYTAYDVAITFLTLSSLVETENKSVTEAIAKAAPQVMTYEFAEKDLLPEEEMLIL